MFWCKKIIINTVELASLSSVKWGWTLQVKTHSQDVVIFLCEHINTKRQHLLLTTTVATKDASPFTLRAEMLYWAVSVKLQLQMEMWWIRPFAMKCPILRSGVKQPEAAGWGITDYLLLDLQRVHVVSALCGVFLRLSPSIDQHVVFVP